MSEEAAARIIPTIIPQTGLPPPGGGPGPRSHSGSASRGISGSSSTHKVHRWAPADLEQLEVVRKLRSGKTSLAGTPAAAGGPSSVALLAGTPEGGPQDKSAEAEGYKSSEPEFVLSCRKVLPPGEEEFDEFEKNEFARKRFEEMKHEYRRKPKVLKSFQMNIICCSQLFM